MSLLSCRRRIILCRNYVTRLIVLFIKYNEVELILKLPCGCSNLVEWDICILKLLEICTYILKIVEYSGKLG